jgi:hypothetical protein
MVEKDVKEIQRDYLTRRAKSVKTVDPKILLGHTRKCYELNQSANCKLVADKPLTHSQSIAYNQILKDQREKEERYVRRMKRREKIERAAPKEEYRNF